MEKQADFNLFPTDSQKEWRERIEKELKGAPFDNVVKDLPEGLKVMPFYNAETAVKSISSNKMKRTWKVREEVDAQKCKDQFIENARKEGVEQLVIRCKDLKELNVFQSLQLPTNSMLQIDSNVLLKERNTLKSGTNEIEIAYKYTGSQTATANQVVASLKSFPDPKHLKIDVSGISGIGGSMVQECTVALLMGNELLGSAEFSKINEVSIAFCFSIGTDFFSEIARLRAFRNQWVTLCEQYGMEHSDDCMVAVQSQWNLTRLDQKNNILRATTAAMAAAAGGCDSIFLLPHDGYNPESTSHRTSRNIHQILRHEGYFDKVADPAAGSYYIEKLSVELGDLIWAAFVAMEKDGGLFDLRNLQKMESEIEAFSANQKEALKEKSRKIVGVNDFMDVDFLASQLKAIQIEKYDDAKRLVTEIENELIQSRGKA